MLMCRASGVAVHTQVLKSDDWAKDAAFTDLEAHKERVSAPRRVAEVWPV